MKPFNNPVTLRMKTGYGGNGDAQGGRDSGPDEGSELSSVV